MKIIIAALVIWVGFCLWITVMMRMDNKCFPNKMYLGVRNKELYKILIQYILLLPHMIFSWMIVLGETVPFKSIK